MCSTTFHRIDREHQAPEDRSPLFVHDRVKLREPSARSDPGLAQVQRRNSCDASPRKLPPVSAHSSPDALLRGRSERLRTFIAEAPLERTSIFAFVAEQARALAPGARVIDVGAGDAPYRELFADQVYVTLDHAESQHTGRVDIVAGAEAIPVQDDSFDAVLCTQILEHVPEPLIVLRELHRVLRAGGVIIATVPFVWEEHELPHDYYRYSRAGIDRLLERAGFQEIAVRPRTDCFTTIAQLVRNAAWAAGSAADGLDPLRVQARAVLADMSNTLTQLAPLDVDMKLPLGYTVRATAGVD